MKERRAEPRLLCSDLIKVRLEDCGLVDLVANLEDISPSGATVLFEQAVRTGTRLRLMLGRHRFDGHVTHCTHNELGFYVGVRFDEGKEWSRRIYEPKHLLDLRELVARKR